MALEARGCPGSPDAAEDLQPSQSGLFGKSGQRHPGHGRQGADHLQSLSRRPPGAGRVHRRAGRRGAERYDPAQAAVEAAGTG